MNGIELSLAVIAVINGLDIDVMQLFFLEQACKALSIF